ncbi:MAG: orotidine-5'-phosphate decarboxylase [Actinobacteria bacterium]|nr:orotidine-5'-phosphate decarboxylase [Actinomycetota bacterium]
MSGSAVRDRLAIALDVGGLVEACRMAERVQPWFGIAKVGYELYAEAGPAAFDAMHNLGVRVFADLKLHDIPNTVARGARVLGRRGVDFLNFHAAGGVEMLRAGVEGLKEGAADAGHEAPIALGVTVLTSDADASAFGQRLEWAAKAGCGGVVCSALEIAAVRTAGLRTMVPGIRVGAVTGDDQVRVATPDDAIRGGADWLVIGRPVTGADDPAQAAAAIHALVEGVLVS